MGTLILTSEIRETYKSFAKYLPQKPDPLNLVFITTAANPYEEKQWLYDDIQALSSGHFDLRELDLASMDQATLKAHLSSVDVIAVGGGNTFYLLQEVRRCGLDLLLPSLLDRGVCYIGASAGSVLVGPTIAPIALLDDPGDAPDLSSDEGLGLVDFVPLVHFGNEQYKTKYIDIISDLYSSHVRFIPVTDKEFILVENGGYRIESV